MSKQKRSKLTTSVTPKNTRQEKPFVQLEGKLTQAQLEAIAGGRLTDNHNETMVSSPQLIKNAIAIDEKSL